MNSVWVFTSCTEPPPSPLVSSTSGATGFVNRWHDAAAPIRHPDKLLLADPKERSGYAVVRRHFDGRLRKNVDGRVATARSRKTLHRAGEC